MDWKDFWKNAIANAIGGVIVLLVPGIWNGVSKTLIVQIVLICCILAFNVYFNKRKCQNCSRKIKIAESTISGEGGTEHILSECNTSFYFMGIAANKWVKKATNFDIVMKRIIAKHGEVRFILLNPMSKDAEKVSLAGNNPATHLNGVIKDNIRALQAYKKMGLNVRVKVYSHMPVFRIAVVDGNKKVYVGSYKTNSDGTNIPQIILDSDSSNQKTEDILRQQFLDYFNVTWNDDSLDEIDIDRVDDVAYMKGFIK